MLARGDVKHMKPLESVYVRMKMNDFCHYNEIKINRVCEVHSKQHKIAYLEHCNHSAAIIQLFLDYVGSDDVNVSRGVRIIVHSRFD